jgi:hypothetical protein
MGQKTSPNKEFQRKDVYGEKNAIGPAWKENTYGKHLRIKIDRKCLKGGKKLGLCIVTDVKHRPMKASQRHGELHQENN